MHDEWRSSGLRAACHPLAQAKAVASGKNSLNYLPPIMATHVVPTALQALQYHYSTSEGGESYIER